MKIIPILSLLLLTIFLTGCTFIEPGSVSSYDPPGFFAAVWHGLLAPWTLIVRWFTEVEMYAVPNSGWFYDFGFLIGIIFSIPLGWMAALVSIALLFF